MKKHQKATSICKISAFTLVGGLVIMICSIFVGYIEHIYQERDKTIEYLIHVYETFMSFNLYEKSISVAAGITIISLIIFGISLFYIMLSNDIEECKAYEYNGSE